MALRPMARLIALVPAVAVAVWASHTAATVADTLNEWINVQQSCQLPFALVPLLLFSNSRRMGAWATARAVHYALCAVAAGLIVVNVVSTLPTLISANGAWFTVLVAVVALLYLAVLGMFVVDAVLPDGLMWLREQHPTDGPQRGDATTRRPSKLSAP